VTASSTRRFGFAAGHRYWVDAWSEAENLRAFLKGKGIEQVELDVKPNGEIELTHARSTKFVTPVDLPGRALREVGKATSIPVLSDILKAIGRFLSPTDISADFSGKATPQGSHVKLMVTQETMNETFLQLFSPILDDPVASAIADEAKDSTKQHAGTTSFFLKTGAVLNGVGSIEVSTGFRVPHPQPSPDGSHTLTVRLPKRFGYASPVTGLTR
jgi:hypothetical protein